MAQNIGGIQASIVLKNTEFKAKIAESKRKVEEFKRSTADASKSVKTMGKNASESAKDVDKLARSSERTKKSLDTVQKGSAIAFAGVALGIGAAVKTAADYEQKMTNVQALTNASATDMARLSEVVQDLGKKTIFSSSEVADGAGELLKAGLSLDQVIGGGLKGALDLATAGELDMAQAAQVASTALNAFRDDNLSVSDAANILAGAANASATDVTEMQQGLAQVSAVASGAGMSFKDTSTALAVFAEQGLRGSDAGTSLKTMLVNLTPSTKKAAALMEKLGLVAKDGSNKFYDAKGNLKSLADVTDTLHQALKDLNPEERGKALKQMFGTDALRAGTILYKEGADGINEMWKAMSNVKAADVAAKKMDTLKGSFDQFTSTLETVGIQVGNEFLPTFRKIVDGATGLLDGLGELNPEVVKIGLVSAGSAAGIALVATSIAKISIALKGLLVGNPIGLVITGLSLLAGGVIAAKMAYDDSRKVNLDYANSLTKTYEANAKQIDQLDALRNKSQLTAEQFQRLVDLNADMKGESDKSKLGKMRDEFDDLQKASGLSNDELQTMLQLNDDLTKNLPGATSAVTDEGNRIADAADAMRDYNSEVGKKAYRELEKNLNKATAAQEDHAKKLADLQKQHTDGMQEEQRIRGLLLNYDDQAIGKMRDQIMLKLDSRAIGAKERSDLETQLKYLSRGKDGLRDWLATQIAHNDELNKGITKEKQAVSQVDTIIAKMNKLVFQEAGLNYEKGRGVKYIDQQIAKQQTALKTLQDSATPRQRATQDYKDQVAKIQLQIGKLEGVRGKLVDIQKEAGKPATKRIDVKVSPNIGTINAQLAHTIYKDVITRYHSTGVNSMGQARAYVDAHRHQGGTFEKPKFHEGGSPSFRQFKMPSAPMSTEIDARLLRNEMVLTEGQQANLFAMLKTPSMVAGGVDLTETNALLQRINYAIQQSGGDVALSIDGTEFARITQPAMSKAQGAAVKQTKRRNGVI